MWSVNPTRTSYTVKLRIRKLRAVTFTLNILICFREEKQISLENDKGKLKTSPTSHI